MRRHLPLTEPQKRAAWAALARRQADFPQTYSEAMAQPWARSLVRIEALRAAERAVQPTAAPAPALPPRAPPGRPAFDPKRAAAGDRDD